MPILRCQKCDQAYDVPPQVAVLLPSSLARCRCGELIFGLREVLAASYAESGDLEELDLTRYRIDAPAGGAAAAPPAADELPEPAGTRSLRVVARGSDASFERIFTIARHPLVIGRRGAHVELDDAELSIRHCEIFLRGTQLMLRDCDSHTGTFLDGEPVTEAVLGEGMHLVRAGAALICIEPTAEEGVAVTPMELAPETLREASPALMKKLFEAGARKVQAGGGARRRMLVAIEGPANGREFEIPDRGLIVGREGDVRVPDEFLSRRHFSLTVDPEGSVRIKDLGSRNGTYLNTMPARNTRVHAGDQIKAGVSVFRVDER
ncbi:MAG TPA: FHA domain-containing protein [Thermoanaerobaculia bacterium]|nr:FHA domain-containing protein [Thermoanaerobaculia bacterium]